MRDDPDAEYSIEVSAVEDPSRPGYVARVVVKQLPAMREVFRDELLVCGGTWPHQQSALAAALKRGQQFVRFELRRRISGDAEGVAGSDPRDPLDFDEVVIVWPQPAGERSAAVPPV